MIDANEKNFSELVREGNVLVDFWAPWCGPCRMMAPVLKAMEADHDLTVVKVNVDENGELARRYSIMSIPTLIFFKDGQKLNSIVGAKPKAALEKDLGLTS